MFKRLFAKIKYHMLKGHETCSGKKSFTIKKNKNILFKFEILIESFWSSNYLTFWNISLWIGFTKTPFIKKLIFLASISNRNPMTSPIYQDMSINFLLKFDFSIVKITFLPGFIFYWTIRSIVPNKIATTIIADRKSIIANAATLLWIKI